VTVTGSALDAAHVKEIYLTTGETDYRMEILEQSDTAVRLRVPAKIPNGKCGSPSSQVVLPSSTPGGDTALVKSIGSWMLETGTSARAEENRVNLSRDCNSTAPSNG